MIQVYDSFKSIQISYPGKLIHLKLVHLKEFQILF
jgi:hypothetical protein